MEDRCPDCGSVIIPDYPWIADDGREKVWYWRCGRMRREHPSLREPYIYRSNRCFDNQLAQAKTRIKELEAHGCEMVERAMVDSESFRKEIAELKADNTELRGVWVDLAESRKILGRLLKTCKPGMDPDDYAVFDSVADAMDDAMKAYKPECREEWYKRVLARGDLRLENDKLQEQIASLTKPEPRYNGMTLSTLTAIVDALLEVAEMIDAIGMKSGNDGCYYEHAAHIVRDKADTLKAIKPETTP